MKKTVVLIAFLFVMSVALMAVQAKTVTSYNPNGRIANPTQHTLQQMKDRVVAGVATSEERATLNAAQQNVVIAPAIGTRDDVICGPQSVANWTGTTDGTTRTQSSLVNGWGPGAEQGYFMFDLSGIPAGSTITQVEFNGFVYQNNWAYWSLTPVTVDPLTASEADLYADMQAEAAAGYYLYQNETATIPNDWVSHVLTGTILEDTEACVAQGWIAMGMWGRDIGTTYYILFEGWNETNPPYLTISYNPPITEPALTSGAIDLEEGNAATEFTYTVAYADPAGNAPTAYNVVIDGSPYAMTPPEGTPDYMDWQTFTYTTTLPVGSHNYYFEFVSGSSTIYFPDTAPETPVALPEVYAPLSGTLVIDAAGGGDYTTFQDCFDDLILRGIDGNVNVEVTAGTYVEEATLDNPIYGSSPTAMVHFYPQSGDVIVDGGAWADWSSIYVYNSGNVWFDGIHLTDGYQGGIRVELSDNVWVSNCVSYANNWVGFGFAESTNCQIWNNFSSNNRTQGIGFYDCGVGANMMAWNNSIFEILDNGSFAMCVTISNSDVELKNNILYRDDTTVTNYGVLFVDQDWTTHASTIIDNNVFFNNGDGSPLVMCYDSGLADYVSYTTLADWTAANGQDANSLEGDPYYDDAANNDLHISNVNAGASPAYQAGTNVGAWFADDIDGDSRVTPWDIGADLIVPPASPVLSAGSVTPELGLESDAYEWSVNYWHPTGTAPTHIYVHIDGNSFGSSMSLGSGNPGDGTYVRTGSLTAGQHTYYFTATTDMGNLRFPETGELTGPEVEDLSLPYTQGFESGTLPAGWSQEYVNDVIDWKFQVGCYGTNHNYPNHTYEGNYNASFYSGNYTSDETKLVTPMFDLTTLSQPFLSFYHTQYAWGSDQDVLSVWYKNAEGGDWTMITEWTENITDWELAEIALPNPTSTYWIAFNGLSEYGYGIGVDNVEINEAPDYLVSILTAPQSGSAIIGEDAIYPVEIFNGGSMSDTYDLAATDNTWDVTFWNTSGGTRSQITDTGVVASGTAVTIYVKVAVPGTAEPGDIDAVTVTVTSQGDNTRMAETEMTTEAVANFDFETTIDLEEQSSFPGETVTYTVSINNTGGVADTYNLTLTGNAWTSVWVDAPSVTVASGDTYDAEVQVTIDGLAGETDMATLTVTSQGDGTKFSEHEITTNALPWDGEGIGFFYTWANSFAPGGPSYNWVTHNTPTEILPLPSDDAEIGPYPIGFDFEFYGVKHDSIYFCANGVLNFDGSQVSYTNYNIPYTSHNEMIAWFWNDLDPDDHEGDEEVHIYYETMAVDGMDALVFTMQNYHQLNGIGDLTAQVILYSNGNIKFQYMLFEDDIEMNSTTVGIQNGSGTDGVLYEYNENRLCENLAIMFYYTPLNFTHSDDGVNYMLDWDAVAGAESYNVYSSTDPFAAPTTWTLETNTTATEYTEPLGTKKFFAITMVKPDPVRNQTRRVEVEQEENFKK